ncbi:helix-turn-helix domain-containing protein [Flagellimonas olearia]|uniref:Helix-turn-helix domain-containing protein n=1 Tax=Flagellimonas olearia TaxID=552546 RepID=A0A6I1E1N6_9FLAO|nr:helix-turn-helix domain-containing protein [Allomuricauda olearia]KAB7530349.1 helix-turn-helix domain-containing protein [Allomuricauda olearia]
MKQLVILVPEGENNLSSIVGPYKIFSRANAHWMERGKRKVFDIDLVGTSKEVNFYDGLFCVRPKADMATMERADLIIVPSLNHNYEATIRDNQSLIDWLRDQYMKGSELASICTGAFLLAAAGLLHERNCSTHWAASADLKRRFPTIHVRTEKLITDENGIYTNGGGYSFLNLMLYLVEKYYDRETAIFCSKVFQIEMDRKSQSSFIIFKSQKMHGDELIKEAQSYIEDNVREKISITDLSSKFPVTRRQFDRRFVKATGNTPLDYIQRVKMEVVKKELETTGKTISEVMYEVGYTDEKAFREVFRRVTGLTPLDYKKRYNYERASLN